MGDFGRALLLFLAVASFPLAAWFGAVVTRDGRPLAGFVRRRFKPIVISLLVLQVVGDVLEDGWSPAKAAGTATTYALAMMFVPMLRRPQESTERSRRKDAAEGAPRP